jgi:signal transduction histidine kinase
MKNMRLARERLSIRAAVFIGFGLILGLWIFAWVQVTLRVSDAQRRAAAINARYVKAQETLSSIRAQVLMASVAFRDALLDPKIGNMAGYRRQLEETYTEVDHLLRAYEAVSESADERGQFARLREEVDGYRSTMRELLAGDRSQWLAEARDLLRQRVTPRRDIVIAVSESVQALNRAAYVEQQTEISRVYRSVQEDLWRLLGLALIIGLVVAVLAVVYAGRLERRLRLQMARDLNLAHDLQDLSAKLVTVQEEERRHIARELHDEIGQALTAVKVELAYAQRSIEAATGPTTVLRDARSITDGALHQVRDLSYLLHPVALDEFGLVSALESYIKTFGKRHEITVDLIHEGMEERLAPETEVAAYRIVQEALTNVAKHAKATECWVRISRGPDALQIVIADNGSGFDSDAPRSGDRRGLGLIGMRERASHLQGTVAVESAHGRGARVIIELPVRRATDRATRERLSDPSVVVS